MAGRAAARTPDLVDASVLRIETGDITSDVIAAAAAEPDVCAVVVTQRRALGHPSTTSPTASPTPATSSPTEGDVGNRVYVKPDCAPHA